MSKGELFNAAMTFVMCGLHLIIIKILVSVAEEPEPAVYWYLFGMVVWSYSIALRKPK